MITFMIGLLFLILGGFFYGKLVEKSICSGCAPDAGHQPGRWGRFVAMPKWKTSSSSCSTLPGPGRCWGRFRGILFGPLAFITIPIGCVLAGAVHDY